MIEDEEGLLGRLTQYSNSKMYPFHMPGHKRRLGEEFGTVFPNPFSIDITEIDGFDNLHHPEGILRDSMDWAAGCYGSDQTYYLVNGSSGGILSAISAVVPFGGKLLMSRNCHKSVYHGVILNHLDVVYTYPQIIPEFGLQGGLSADQIESLLITHKNVDAVFLVSPTYDGIVSDIGRISAVVHKFGIPLIVDEAHGAHFSYGSLFPVSALGLGADVVIQSLHKTLPSLTQTALLHVKKGRVNLERLEQYLAMYQTSSPSYVLMGAIETCIRQMNKRGDQLVERFGGELLGFFEEIRALKRLKRISGDLIGRFDIFDMDCSKILISCRGTDLDGPELARRLRERYQIEMEMCGADYVTAIATLADQREGFSRLSQALLEIDEECLGQPGLESAKASERPETASMSIWEGFSRKTVSLPLEESVGRRSGEFVYLYPPGIPVLAPGEEITKRTLELILSYRRLGLPIQGMGDRFHRVVRVLEEDVRKFGFGQSGYGSLKPE